MHDLLPHLESALQRAGHDRDSARSLATLALAIERGLLLDRLATGERGRVEDVQEHLLRLL